MSWNLQSIRKNAWDTTFHRGLRAWLSLVAVCFVFAFIGASNASQTYFIDLVDSALGTSDVMLPHNVSILDDYLGAVPVLASLPPRLHDLALSALDSFTKTSTWIVRLLALNPSYLARNPDEALATTIVITLLTIFLRFCVQNVLVVGQHRYVMETRFSREVDLRRTLAPFHRDTLLNVVWVMVCYHVTLALWWLTIAGGIYKSYQYAMVPYLLAENQSLTWREARELSKRMTEGHKLKMFQVQLSYAYLFLLEAIPVIGLLVTVPLMAELNAEFYFALRANPALGREAFVERAFDATPCAQLPKEGQERLPQPLYLLKDLDLEPPRVASGPLPYPVVDLIYCFFVFCFIGWVWEVGLHLVQFHEFVNRGTLYGPWIPIYGVGGTCIIVLLDRFRESPARLFGMAVLVCAVLEYACSWVLDFMFNASYWNYDGMLFNVNGRICLAGLVAFGLGGLVGVYVAAPAISRKVGQLSPKVRYGVAGALLAAFASDLGYCVVNGFNSGAGVGESLD